MRSALLFTTILLFAIVPFSNPVTADGLDENSGITISASFDNSTEMTAINITMPLTNNATLLDEMKDTTFSIYRIFAGDWPVLAETIASEIQFCTQGSSNSECSGSSFEIEYYPLLLDSHTEYEYVLAFNSVFILSNTLEEIITPSFAVENLSGAYSDDVTTLTWDYPEGIPMNHSVMIYSHDSPATRENWNGMAKTIVSSSVSAGTTSYDINYSEESVEREIFYSVTLLYETSEDTRFIGTNTLSESVKEDNTAPLFIGELSASFNPNTDTTLIDWGEGVADEDLTINIYRSELELQALDPNSMVAVVDASMSSYELQIPIGEHRQSWYAISLADSQGNEILELTEASPVAEPIIETTTTAPSVSDISAERFADGTITIFWEDNTQNPNTIARLWRSIEGPIQSLDNVQELTPINASAGQFSHNPLNAADQVWYAITIEGTWGTSTIPWHYEELNIGSNSMSSPFRETENISTDEPTSGILAQVQSSTGVGGNISDGSLISLGAMYEGDIIIISTSSIVTNISCHEIAGQGTSIGSGLDWTLSFSANQTGETCLGTIVDGQDEIGFTLTWNYIETIANNSEDTDVDDSDNATEKDDTKGKNKNSVSEIILAIVIAALLLYLFVMLRPQNHDEEE
ncbi:MAG: hypothetical protein HOE76_02260 [Euryarchaeota archaeon]|jgi:hypothetical protein|nr:hypothetical protein [Euryarchaeota archaeon]MBT4981884.1 hypothetical protein [Euryarchaeota archaeon]MBT5184338.1 hypothetical protein [Euryarchaeota archaeon]